jgi:hypothetical protein
MDAEVLPCLYEVTDDRIGEARALNAAGHVTGAGRPFDNDVVASLRHCHQIPRPAPSKKPRSPWPSPTGRRGDRPISTRRRTIPE